MQSLNYNHLYYFHIIATEGSLKRAAEKLSLSQSTLSEQLKSLESYFGTRLFDRKASGLRLNDSGSLVRQYTDIMFGAGQRLSQSLQENSQTRKQVIQVGIAGFSVVSTLGQHLAQLFTQQSSLIHTHTADVKELYRRLMNYEIDVVITDEYIDEVSEDVSFQPIKDVKYSLLAADDFNLPAQDEPLPLMILSNYEHDRQFQLHQLQEFNIPVAVQGETDDIQLFLHTLMTGNVAGFAPEAAFQKQLHANDLQLILPKTSFTKTIRCIVHANYKNEALKNMLAVLKHSGKPNPEAEEEIEPAPNYQ